MRFSPNCSAQTFSVLHSFSAAAGPNATNADGASAYGGLVINGDTLFGTARFGGSFGAGTIFTLSTVGTEWATLFHFTGGADGANPVSDLTLAGQSLFGTASSGGISGAGTLFSINTNGAAFTALHTFTTRIKNAFGVYTNSDGAHPIAPLLLSGPMLYGAAYDGGGFGHGTLFALNTSGSTFTTLHNGTSGSGGAYSSSSLIVAGDMLYGTDYSALGHGAVFSLFTDGNGFTNHYAFTAGNLNYFGVLTNTDGANPRANLVSSGDVLYGTTAFGGDFGNGTIFAIKTDGSGFTNLHSFAAGAYRPSGLYTNRDGANPLAGLVASNNWLYGTASAGGTSGNGALFALRIDGTGFTNIYSFSATPAYPAPQTNNDGANPFAGLALSGTTLFGTAVNGGHAGNGTVFSLTFAPRLTIQLVGSVIVITWPTNTLGFDFSGFILQSAPSISGPFTNLVSATTPFTNSPTTEQQFFRLIE